MLKENDSDKGDYKDFDSFSFFFYGWIIITK
jgi:hypothetical protein